MPFRSKAQRRWMYANHPEMAKHWQEHTKGSLPERKGPSREDLLRYRKKRGKS